METLADRITIYLIEKGAINDDDYAIYKYGLQTGMETCICLCTCAIIATYLGVIGEFFIIALTFCPLRTFVGGIHMKHFFACYLSSVIIIIVGALMAREMETLSVVGVILTICIMYLIHRLSFLTTSKEEKAKDYFALQRRRILICMGIFFLFFVLIGVKKISFIVSYTVFIILISITLEIVKEFWVRHK